MKLELDPEFDLQLRTKPQQDRARATVERILDTAASLIEEVGIDGFTTNLLAERCGVRVRSVYRYFPNKHAVIAALYQRLVDSWQSDFEDGFARIADSDLDWRTECDDLVDGFVTRLKRHRGAIAVRRAMKAEPGLIEIERADNERLGKEFARIMRRRVKATSRSDLERVGRSWLNAISVLIDIALERVGAERTRQIDEAKRMQRAYLATYLD